MKHVGLLFKGEMIRAILRGDKWVTRRIVNLDKLRVKPRRDVHPDTFPGMPPEMIEPISARAGKSYPAHLNPLGAVSALIDGKNLGLKPGEFDFVCPYASGPTELAYLPNGKRVWTIYAQETQWWAREMWRKSRGASGEILFAAELSDYDRGEKGPWKPGIHLRREHSRITGPVLTVRLEHLHDIDEADAKAEGVKPFAATEGGDCWSDGTHRSAYEYLWGAINGWQGKAKARSPWVRNDWVWRIEFKRAAAKAWELRQ